jgi:hypothetical protein
MKTRSLVLLIVGLVVAAVLVAALLGTVAGLVVYNIARRAQTPLVVAAPGTLGPVFDSPSEGYRIRPPLHWMPQAGRPADKPLWICPVPDDIGGKQTTANIHVAADTMIALEDYTAAALRRHQQDHADFRLISDRHVSINARAARIIDYTYTTAKGTPLHILQALVAGSGGRIYIVTAVAHVQAWERHRATIDSSVATLELTR